MTNKQETEYQFVLTDAHNDFEKKLNTYAFFRTSDRARGEDLVQDTFVKTWSYMVKGGKITMMRAFLYRVLNNLIVDEYRKQKTNSLDALLESGFEPSVDDSSRLFNFLDGKSALLLIKRLPMTYQRIMRMRYVQDLSLAEMSVITGQSRNNIGVKLNRGLGKLKLLYNPVSSMLVG